MKHNLKPYQAIKSKVGFLFYKGFAFTLYSDLYRMPLRKYIDLVVDNDLKAVKRFSFLPTPVKICYEKAVEFQKEYEELAESKDFVNRLSLVSDVNFMRYKMFFFSHALKLIHDFDNMQGCIDFFNKNGYYGTREEIINEITGELLGLKSNLEDAEHRLELQNKEAGKSKLTRADYARAIAVACKNGYHVDYNTSVADFRHALKLQEEEVRRLNSKA